MQKIVPFLWFDNNVDQALAFYQEVFSDFEVLNIARYSEGGMGEPGSVMLASIRLFGQQFNLLNGGPHFKFNEAVSFVINCADQAEVDYYWDKLTGNGGEESMCGWLKDRFGLSWQVVPTALGELLSGGDPEQNKRATQAMLKMRKLDIAALRAARDGQ
ncbi:MAG: VOC family protein [Calditrichaeota bacterium]|nr:VOC family protein [Calditrichota bacterium]HQU71378.1 VOC family protein [Calditrichia bacterium]